MLIVHVDVRVLPDLIDEFLVATQINARASLREPGVLRFDVLQDETDATHVLLAEIYRGTDAAAAHKDTPHYATWRDVVAPMMARPRTSTRYSAVFPVEPERWDAGRE